MQRNRASLLWTGGALAVALSFVGASLTLVTSMGSYQGAVERGARSIRQVMELSTALGAIDRNAFAVREDESDERARARCEELVAAYDAVRRAQLATPDLDVVGPTLRASDDRIEALRAGLGPLFALGRDSPERLRSEHALHDVIQDAEDLVAGAIRDLRARMTALSVRLRDLEDHARLLLYVACPVALLAALLILLHQRDTGRLLDAQRARLAADEKVELLLTRTPALLWSTDRELRLTSRNGSALLAGDAVPGGIEGATLLSWLGPDAPEREPRRLHERALSGETVDGELVWPDRTWLCRVAPLRAADGTIEGTLGVALDVTAQKRAEQALLLSEERVRRLEKVEALGRLAGAVAHDFNNYLTALLGNAELLRDRLPAGDPLLEEVNEILDTIHRASALTRQLLAFRGRQPPREVPVDVGDVVRELLPLLRRQCGAAIEVAIRIESDLPRVAGDPSQIEQVVLNLALNARDAMPDGGRLTIRVERAKEEKPALLLAVADNGTGMDEEVRRRLFEPFFTTKPANGTGLGLSIVHDVVQRCGGTIEVESQKGRGSEFRVLLPAESPAPAPS
jgi:signal transduction histidine kinase